MTTKITITEVEKKNEDWLIVQGRDDDGLPYDNASINRKDKNGVLFPNFDEIKEGSIVECEPWKNSSGKWYFFPPKPQKETKGFGGAAKAMETKAKNIEKSMDRKEEGIMTSSTMRDAVLIVTTIIRNDVILCKDEPQIKKMIEDWRQWLLDNWELPPSE